MKRTGSRCAFYIEGGEGNKKEGWKEEEKSIRIPLILIPLISFLLVFFRSIEPSPADHVLVKYLV